MQSVSGSWIGNVTASSRNVSYGLQMSWPQTVVTSNFFTIGTSLIGGPDMIKSGGSVPTFFDKYQYTDYSQYLISMSVSQKIGQFPYGTIMAQANVQLDNSNKLFTPGYDATIGAYILPNRPIKLGLGFNGETLQQFTGFTNQPHHDRTELAVTMTAFDAFNYVATYVSTTTPIQVNQRTDQIIAAGLAEMGFSPSQYVLDQSLMVPIGALAPYGLKWGDIFQSLCEAEQALMFVDENGIFRFWNRQHFLTTGGSVWSLDSSLLENLQTEDTPIFNDVIVTANPRIVGTKQRIWDAPSIITLPPGNTVVTADFSDENGPLPVTTVDAPVQYHAAVSSTFTANSAADGSGTDVSVNINLVSSTLQGSVYTMTFSNVANQPMYMTKLSLFGTPAKVSTHIAIRYTDAASVSKYGINPGNNGDVLQINNDYIQDQGTANSLAYTLVHEYKDSKQRYLAYPSANPAIQIGDVLTVTDPDSGIVRTMYVTGRTVTLGVGELSQVLEIEERSIQHYFQIGVSLISGTDGIAP